MALVEYGSNTTPTMIVPDGAGGIWNIANGTGTPNCYVQKFNATLTSRTDYAIGGTFYGDTSYGGCLGPDGRLFFTDTTSNTLLACTTGGTITRYTTGFASKGIQGITSDGTDLYVACHATDEILKVTASTGAVAATISLTAGKGVGQVVYNASAGKLFFTCDTTSQIGSCTTGGGSIAYTNTTTGSAYPFGICNGPDGNIWFVELVADKIGVINTSLTMQAEYATGVTSSSPRYICSDGTALWFTDLGGDRYCKISTSGTVTQYSPTATSQPYGIAYYSGRVYFSEYGRANVGSDSTAVTTTYAFTADAMIVAPGTATVTADAIVKAESTKTFTADAIVAKYPVPSATAPPESGSPVEIVNDTKYNAFPALCVAPNDDLLVAYTQGTSHSNADQVIKLKRSTDDGATWGAATTVSTATYACATPGLTTLSDGSIVLSYYETNLSTIFRNWTQRSTDGGVTWGSPVRIPTSSTYYYDVTNGNMGAATAAPVVEDPGNPGHLAIAMHGANSGQNATYCTVQLATSTDYGQSWSVGSYVYTYDGATDGFEPWLLWVRKNDGTYELHCYIRSEIYSGGYRIRRSVSSDGGTTWGALTSCVTGLAANTQPSVFQIPDGGILIQVREPLGSSPAAYAHSFRYSSDYGVSFGSTITIDNAGGDVYGQWNLLSPTLLGHVYALDKGPTTPYPNVTNTDADVYFQAFTVSAAYGGGRSTKTFTADAIVASGVTTQGTRTFTADAIVQAQGVTATFTADAIVSEAVVGLQTYTKTFTADAVINSTPDAGFASGSTFYSIVGQDLHFWAVQ